MFRKTFISLLVLCLTSYIASAAPTLDLCANCTIVNGAGYNSHPTDCDKFVQCHQDAYGALVGEVQQCGFGTIWDMDLLVCMPADQASCPNDKCIGQPDGLIREGIGNCRGFWECIGDKSVAKCCPSGQHFNSTDLTCTDNIDDECTDSCFNEVYVANETATTTVTPCLKRPVSNKPGVYLEHLPVFGWFERPCPIGTVFSESECDCVMMSSDATVASATCKPEIYLPFTHDHFDHSGKGNYVQNENVVIQNGVAKFNGVNSRLVIPRFTNFDSANVVIKVKYTSKHIAVLDAQAILSNNDCGISPSIKITEDNQQVNFTVGTDIAIDHMATVFVDQTPMGPLQETAEKDIVYRFVDNMLTGTVNGVESQEVTVPGHLRHVHCALHIGHAEDAKRFNGEIDELTIYLCDPNN